jgi:hypothetical protein
MENTGVNLTSIPRYQPPEHMPSKTVFDKILRLDSLTQPGLPEADFKRLFVRCGCGLVMTTRSFGIHRCLRVLEKEPVIIDLTGDLDDE